MGTFNYRGYKLDLGKGTVRYDWYLIDLKEEGCDALWLPLAAHKAHAEALRDRIVGQSSDFSVGAM